MYSWNSSLIYCTDNIFQLSTWISSPMPKHKPQTENWICLNVWSLVAQQCMKVIMKNLQKSGKFSSSLKIIGKVFKTLPSENTGQRSLFSEGRVKKAFSFIFIEAGCLTLPFLESWCNHYGDCEDWLWRYMHHFSLFWLLSFYKWCAV